MRSLLGTKFCDFQGKMNWKDIFLIYRSPGHQQQDHTEERSEVVESLTGSLCKQVGKSTLVNSFAGADLKNTFLG